MRNEDDQSAGRCAYELCQKAEEPLAIIPGHRPRRYHDDACRQAAHRLLQQRAALATLRQSWVDFLPATQKVLEELCNHGLAASLVRALVMVIAHERDQARQPTLTEDERSALMQQWSEMQPFTRTLLDGLLTARYEPLHFFSLVLLAIGEEQQHAACNSTLEQRNAYLEVQLAEYRRIIDLDERAQIRRQFLVIGQSLAYRALPTFRLAEGQRCWEEHASWTDERTLADVVLFGRELLAEEETARLRAQEKRLVRQVEQELREARRSIEMLEHRLAEQQAHHHRGGKPVALVQVQAYLHAHPGGSVPLRRGRTTYALGLLRDDGVAAVVGQGLLTLTEEELQQLEQWVNAQP